MNTPKVLQKFWALSLVILLAGFIGIGQTSAQTNYFVDTVAGNNTFNGSQMAVGGFPNGPFKTIAAATAVAVDGDTVTILANSYAEGISTTAAVTYEVQTSGGNTVVTISSITHNSAADTATYTDAAGGGVGTFALTGGITLTAGTVNFGTAVVVATGQTITRTLGALTGTAPTTTNVNVTYNGALTAGMTAGNELPASLGSGKLTLSHTGDLLTIPNAVSVNDVQSTTTGDVTFASTLTTTAGGATDVDIDANNTFTVSGTATIAGGIDIDAAATISMGATSIAANTLDNNGGAATFASVDLNGQNLLNTSGTIAVTGDLTVGIAATGTRVTVTAGSVTVGTLTADPLVDTGADEADVVYTINNDATFTVNGAISEGVLVATAGEGAAPETEYSVFTIDNATGQEFSIGASSTIRGDINNAERDAGVDGDGIILNNNATLTIQADDDATGTITSFGDVVGGTLSLNYANGNTDSGDVTNNQSITLVNNLAYGDITATLAAPAADADAAITVGGNLSLGASVTFPYNFTVTGIVTLTADNVVIDGHAAGPTAAGGTQAYGGFNAGAFTATFGTGGGNEAISITGTQADFNDSTVNGVVTANTAVTGPGALTASAGASFDGVTVGSVVLSGTGQVDIDGPLDVGGSVTIPAGLILDQTALGGGSDIDGNLNVNGSFDIAGGGTLTIDGDVNIDATTGDITTANATTFNLNGNFTGGSYPGVADTWVVNTASGGTTIAVKPGTTLASLTVNGSGLTSTFTESVTVSGGITVGNDAIVALGANNFVLTGGDLTLNDEASITNDGVNGSVQFTATGAVTQNIIVGGTPTTNPTLQNVVMNMSHATGTLDMDQAINISGTFTALDGQLTDANLITFTGANGELAIAPAAASVTGDTNGVHDLEYLGAVATGGAEYTAIGIRNLTINMTAAVLTLPATNATISGNVVVNAGSGLTTQESMAVQGNATFNGNVIAEQNEILNISGNLTVADGISITGSGADATVELSGASSTHSIIGVLGANTILDISGTDITVNGSIAGGDVDADSEFEAITVDATGSATFTSVQDINGAVTVDGTAVITLVSDGGNVDVDGQVTGNINVNGGGSLTLASNDATVTAIGGTLVVDDNGSFILGSSLGSTGDVTVGDGSDATEATFNLNGNTFIPGGGVNAITVVASGAPATAPTFGTSGTLDIPTGGEIVGATNPTIPNLTINGGAAIDSDVTVSGTFTVAAASTGEDGDDVTVAGIAQINANYTGTAGPTGPQLDITGEVLNTTAAAVTITNLGIASTSTTLASRTGASTIFSVSYLDHDSGELDISEEIFTLTGVAIITDWDHDGGTYAGTGTYVMTGAADEIDLSTNGETISVPNLTVNGAAGGGIQLSAAGDGLTVTGTLTLNGTAPNVETEVGVSDATFTMGNGSTILRSTSGAGDHFDNAPTLGTGMTVRYTNTAADVTTANELPTTLLRIEYESDGTAGDDLILEDGVAVTVDQIESSGDINIDLNGDGDNSITITDGGRIEYDGGDADFTFDTPVVAGAITYRWDVTDTTTDLLWPDAQTGATVSVTDGTVTLHESRTAGVLVAGDGTGAANSATLALGANTLTVSGATTIDLDGAVTGAGTLNTDGVVTNSGTLSSVVVASKDLTLTGNIASLTLDGTTAQTVTVPAAGATFATALVVNNAAGATFAGMTSGSAVLVGAQVLNGGGSAVATVTAGLTLTNGVLTIPDGNSLILPHGGSGLQGYSRTNGCVFGNIRKQLSNTTSTAPADRMDFPLCSAGGLYRPYAVTFNNPNTIGGVAPTAAPATTDASPAITVRHDVSGENSVVELSGTNGLAQTVNGVSIARYPQAPSFFWTVSPNFTMSPSLSYDVDMRANDYANFSSSCGASACDINEIYPVRRHVGSTSNLWSVASSTTDNFLAGVNDPVVIGRSATGALQSSGTVFTYGLKSIFAAANNPAAIAVSTGNTNVVDLSALFTGYTGALTYTAITSSAAGVANPILANIVGNNLTVTGGATAGAATITVTATDSFGGTASASFVTNNSAALVAAAGDLNRTLNVTGTSDVTYASVFSGGTAVVAYTASSDNAAVTVVSDGTKVTVTAATVGSATITLTATDASTTPVVVTKTFVVSVNSAFSATNVGSTDVLEGATSVVTLSAQFAGGTAPYTYAAPTTCCTGAVNVTAAIANGVLTATAVDAYTANSTIATVTVSVVGTDAQGDTATFTLTLNVLPNLGDLDGQGVPSANSANIALKHFLGTQVPALTAKQIVAADFNSDTVVNPYDAYLIWLWPATPKGAVLNATESILAFGSVNREGNTVTLPVVIDGLMNDVASVSFTTQIDPILAKVVSVTSDVEGWMLESTISEDGTVRIAGFGMDALPADGVIATIQLQLNDGSAQFSVKGEGALNNNAISEIEGVEIVELPGTFALKGNYPNPFNPTTTIQFDLPETADVEVQIFDMVGRQVMTLSSQSLQAGTNRSLQLNASSLASGSYFYRVIAKMQSKTAVDTGRLTLIK